MGYIKDRLVGTLGDFFSYWDMQAWETSIFDAILAAPSLSRTLMIVPLQLTYV